MDELNIFEMLYPNFKITKPIRLIELFAGYGSQALALKYLGINFEHWKTCEWAVKSIQAYKDIHFTDVDTDYSKDLSKEELVKWLLNKGISQNYNEAMNEKQISRLSEKELKRIYNNIQTIHNLVNVQQVKGKDLNIVDVETFTYLLTYSFPCQDLSLAGKRKGMADNTTRSGMLWEVERILDECEHLPQVLLMENVPQVHSTENIKFFNKWKAKLEKLGYKNYAQDLIATDYGIPQTRNRCFMVSILGDYNYKFPKPQELKLRLKDLLEKNVSEKYYLSQKQLKEIEKWNAYEKPLENITDNIVGKLTTRSGAYCAGMKLVEDRKIRLPEATQKGYAEASLYDGVDLGYLKQNKRRGRVQKQAIQTLTTQNSLGVVTLGYYLPSGYNSGRVVDKENVSPTVMENHGTVIATNCDDLTIRKLTPREFFRLQGVKDEDFDNCKVNQSESSLYHLAGDSICVNVLMAIFEEMI